MTVNEHERCKICEAWKNGLTHSVNDCEVNKRQIESVESYYGILAGESVTAELITNHWYIYGSELAVLRLFGKCYNTLKGCTWDYSENLETFYFQFDTGES